jgi:hypothetical protein
MLCVANANAECHYAECTYTKCHYTECHDAFGITFR